MHSNIPAKRIAAALIYAALAYAGALGVWNASNSPVTELTFFAWNVACALLFAYLAILTSGRAVTYTLLVVLTGPALQVATVNVLVAGAFGQPLGTALAELPGSLASTMVRDPLLYAAWFGVPALAAATVLYFKRDAMRTGA